MSKPFSVDRIKLGALDLVSGSVDPNTLVLSPTPPIGSRYYQSNGAEWINIDGTNTGWIAINTANFGDGSDGDVTLGAGTTTLARDMFYRNLTIPNGATLATARFRIFVQNTLTTVSGGILQGNGAVPVGSTGGVVIGGSATLSNNSAGGNGGINAGSNGGASNGVDRTLPGQGGGGGAGAGGAGGNGGLLTSLPVNNGGMRGMPTALIGHQVAFSNLVVSIKAGSGGGGGGGDTAVAGGGGGAGGTTIVLAARTIVNNGAIQSRGGDGGPGTAANRGGGGGGGGGTVWLTTMNFTGNTVDVSGGTGGAAGGGSGLVGVDGALGLVITLRG